MDRPALAVFALVVIVGISMLTLNFSSSDTTAPLITYRPLTSPVTNSIGIKSLEVGEYIGQRNPSFSDAHLGGLAPGVVVTQDSRADYTQSLLIYNPPLFRGGRITYTQDEYDKTSDFLQFSDSLFQYVIEFGTGLSSKIEDNGDLEDIEDEYINVLGSTMVFTDAHVDLTTRRIELTLFGGFGHIRLVDNDYSDGLFTDGVQINQDYVNARVKIDGFSLGRRFVVSTITYILNADAKYGSDVYVPPGQCARNHLQYPAGMLSPSFDICYSGLEGDVATPSRRTASGNQVVLNARGDDEYELLFTNIRGNSYRLPLAQLDGGLSYGNRGRNLVFREAANAGAPNIAVDDYFVVNHKDSNTGVTNVLRYNSLNPAGTVTFEELSTGIKQASFNPSNGEGTLSVGSGQYRFVVDLPTKMIAMDQTNDGSISSDEAKVVVAGGQIIDLGPGFTVRMTTLSKLFDEASGDETTRFDIITTGGDIDVNVPSPQGDFKLLSEGRSVKSGSTRYGIIWRWDSHDVPGEIDISIPGTQQYGGVRGGAQGTVVITTERAKLVKSPRQQFPAGPVCGNSVTEAPEQCDPPGSSCVGARAFERGICSNKCTCETLPESVCGNGIVEYGEGCERDSQCGAGNVCANCQCAPAAVPQPPVQPPVIEQPVVPQPTPPPIYVEPQPNIFVRFWNWLTSLF